MMKIKCKKILWVRLLMYSLVMGTGIFLVRQKWNEQARVTFKTALLQELQKRDTLSIPYISNWTATSALEEINPRTVEVESALSKRKRTDSLLTYYMGHRCEVEAIGYASCYWWGRFSGWRLLTPQTAILLEVFLQAEGHTLIPRLRKSIGELTTLQVKFKNDSYHLIIPHFIGKNALTNLKLTI